jgi:hypothetical protein
LLCADLTGACDKCDCCERKNRSIEGRFHRVTPYAAVRLLFILDVSRDELFGQPLRSVRPQSNAHQLFSWAGVAAEDLSALKPLLEPLRRS